MEMETNITTVEDCTTNVMLSTNVPTCMRMRFQYVWPKKNSSSCIEDLQISGHLYPKMRITVKPATVLTFLISQVNRFQPTLEEFKTISPPSTVKDQIRTFHSYKLSYISVRTRWGTRRWSKCAPSQGSLLCTLESIEMSWNITKQRISVTFKSVICGVTIEVERPIQNRKAWRIQWRLDEKTHGVSNPWPNYSILYEDFNCRKLKAL